MLHIVPNSFDVPSNDKCMNLKTSFKNVAQYNTLGVKAYSDHKKCADHFDSEAQPDNYWGCRCSVQGEYIHFTIIFNAFVFCQIFNEFNARSIKHDAMAAFRGLTHNPMFVGVIVTTVL